MHRATRTDRSNHRVHIEGPSSVHVYTPTCVAGVYLIYFVIGNQYYTPCSAPSRIVHVLDVMDGNPPPKLMKFTTRPLYIQGARGIDTQIDANFLT